MSQNAAVYSDLSRLNAWRFHVKHLKLGHQQRMAAQTGGSHHTPRKGRGMEFNEVRLYQAGDDVRHMDWRVTARTQKPHTKLFSEEHERPIIFIVEQSASLFFGSTHCFKSVLALDCLAILSWSALNQGDRVGGLVFGQNKAQWIEPKRQDKTLQLLFQQALNQNTALTSPGNSNHQAWWLAMKQVTPFIHPASRVVLIGDLFNLDSAAFNVLQKLTRHANISGLHIQDSIEVELPKTGTLTLTNGQQQSVIDTDDERIRLEYSNHNHQAWLALKQRFMNIKAPIIALNQTQPTLEKLLQTKWLRR